MLRPGSYSSAATLAARYGVSVGSVYVWTRLEGFPQGEGSARSKVYPDAQVDAWVNENRPASGTAARAAGPFSSGDNPRDLLNITEFAEVRARHYGKKPVSATTMTSYLARRQIPQPDRTPNDGQQPEVPVMMWYRSTVDAHVGALRGPGNRSSRPRGRSGPRRSEASD